MGWIGHGRPRADRIPIPASQNPPCPARLNYPTSCDSPATVARWADPSGTTRTTRDDRSRGAHSAVHITRASLRGRR